MSRKLFSAAVELLRVLFDYLFDYLYSHIYIIEFSSTDESVAEQLRRSSAFVPTSFTFGSNRCIAPPN